MRKSANYTTLYAAGGLCARVQEQQPQSDWLVPEEVWHEKHDIMTININTQTTPNSLGELKTRLHLLQVNYVGLVIMIGLMWTYTSI